MSFVLRYSVIAFHCLNVEKLILLSGRGLLTTEPEAESKGVQEIYVSELASTMRVELTSTSVILQLLNSLVFPKMSFTTTLFCSIFA